MRRSEQPLDLFGALRVFGPVLKPSCRPLGQLGDLGRRQRPGQEGIAKMHRLADLDALAGAFRQIYCLVNTLIYDLQQREAEVAGNRDMR